MPRTDRPSGYYYYYAGKPISLTVDGDWMAVSSKRLEALAIPPEVRTAIRQAATPVNRDVLLARRAVVSGPEIEALDHAGAIDPVFRHGGARHVVLPEVRVEESSPERRRAVHEWLRKHAGLAEIVQDQGDRIVLRPASGRGSDALDLANSLTEDVGPEMAQARFLRILKP